MGIMIMSLYSDILGLNSVELDGFDIRHLAALQGFMEPCMKCLKRQLLASSLYIYQHQCMHALHTSCEASP